MRVALYLRRSTDEKMQADSLAAQESLLSKVAGEHGHRVVRTFQDSASGRSVKRRPGFLGLIEEVQQSPRLKQFSFGTYRDGDAFQTLMRAHSGSSTSRLTA